MGTYRIEITAVGGHGCDRAAKEGDELKRCGQPSCPDCSALAFVDELKKSQNVQEATLTHWPAQSSEVRDDLLTGRRRRGSF